MEVLIRISLIGLLAMVAPLHARTIEAHNIPQLFAAISQLGAGDTLLIHPGAYVLDKPLVIDGDYSYDQLYVLARDTHWTGEGLPYLLDLRGECITWKGGEFSGSGPSVVEIRGNRINFGYVEVHGTAGKLAERGIGLIGTDHEIHHCHIHHLANIGIDGNGGEVGANWEILRLNSDDPYRSVQNWHIYGNHIHDIEVQQFGIHEGAMKLVPMVRGVYIYDNLIERCAGQGIWLDRPEGDVLIYGNVIRDIAGKGIFYEISDDFTGTFGVIIVRNRIESSGRQPIWIAASNHATVIGNYARGALPSGAGAMPREINRQNGEPGTGRQMTLTGNHFAWNVLVPTGAVNHLVVYDYSSRQDGHASDNTFSGNYYATGHAAGVNGRTRTITEPGFRLDRSRSIARNSSETGLQIDPSGVAGPDPGGFYFSDEEIGLEGILDQFPEVKKRMKDAP